MFEDFFEMLRPAPAEAFRKYDARSKLNSEAQRAAYALGKQHKSRALFWGRRSGKTTLVQHEMIEAATETPNCAVAFVGPTINQAIKLVWDEFVEWSKEVGGVARQDRHEIKFPNKSVLYLLGSETRAQIDRIRGLKRLRYLAWDEQQNYDEDDATYALGSVMMPMLADLDGSLVLMGTGGPERGHWFNIVNHGNTKGPDQPRKFAVSQGVTMWDNPIIGERGDQVLADACALLGVAPGDPYILREYGVRGQGIRFTTDSDKCPFRNIPIADVPELAAWEGWTFALGGDVGSADLCAGAVGALHPHHNGAIMAEVTEEKTPAATEQIEFFRKLLAKYAPKSVGPVMVALDPGGGGAGVIVDLGRMGHFWEAGAADKFDKGFNVRLMAGDIRTGWLKLVPGCELAKKRLESLEWEPGKEGHKLKGHTPDAADASLYMWRLCRKLFDSIYIGPKPEKAEADPHLAAALEQDELEAQILGDLGFN